MKRVLFFLIAISIANITYAQQQKGDSEIQLSGFISKAEGQSFGQFESEDYFFGSVALKFGQFITDNLQIGVSPSLLFQTGENSDVTVGAGGFLNYSFLASDAKTVPYFGFSYRKEDIEEWDFDNGRVGAQLGFKQFVTPKTAFDISGNYLFAIPVADQDWDFSDGFIYLSFGFSYLF